MSPWETLKPLQLACHMILLRIDSDSRFLTVAIVASSQALEYMKESNVFMGWRAKNGDMYLRGTTII